jgi:hypothetical protein
VVDPNDSSLSRGKEMVDRSAAHSLFVIYIWYLMQPRLLDITHGVHELLSKVIQC